MLWIRIPVLEIFIVPGTAQRHNSFPSYFTWGIWMFVFSTFLF